MKSRGFTLIELLVSMLIILIFTTISFRGHTYLTTMKEKTLLHNTRVECKDFISISKGYCKEKDSTGYIICNMLNNASNDTFEFYIDSNCIRKLIIKDNIKVSKTTFPANRIYIDNTGYIKNAGTIYFYNKTGQNFSLSVGVYTNSGDEK